MKKKIIQYLKDVLLLLVIAFAVTFVLQVLELAIYGKVEPRSIDNIIGLVLGISIYMNIKSYGALRRIRKLLDKWK